jgi:two-component system, OmpR family, KDP operon response regulator KdpE
LSSIRILNVDENPRARRELKIAFVARGFEVDEATSGEEALSKMGTELPDVVLLDVVLPGMSGIETCRSIRALFDVPIIAISVKKTCQLRADAFEAGADQYLVRPFDIEELIMRVRALVNRYRGRHSRIMHLDGVEVDLDSHEVRRDGRTVHLTAKEFKLLHCLSEHAGEVVSHRGLLQAVWGPDYGNEVEYLRVFINQVRKKIEPDPRKPRFLITEPFIGYRLSRQAVRRREVHRTA